MRALGRWLLVFLAAGTLAAGLTSAALAETRRIALLVGNSDYSAKVGPLKNPGNDIQGIRTALIAAGFNAGDIRVVANATRLDIKREVDAFATRASALSSSDIAFFYYSGHGAWRPGARSMSLIPVDATDAATDDFWYSTINLDDEVLRTFTASRSLAAWIIAIDACRNELRLPTRDLGGSGDKAFQAMPSQAGMLISFAADEGQTARDLVPGGGFSPYAASLIEGLALPGLSASGLFSSLRPNVMRRTSGAQQPVLTNKLNVDPVLNVAAPGNPQVGIVGANPTSAPAVTRSSIVAIGPAEPELNMRSAPPPRAPARTPVSEFVVSVSSKIFLTHALSPDEKMLVTGEDAAIRVWSTETGKQIAFLAGHPNNVKSLSFSPDGTRLASAGDDPSIRVWDTRSWKLVAAIPEGGNVQTAKYTPDGKYICSGKNAFYEAVSFKGVSRQGIPCGSFIEGGLQVFVQEGNQFRLYESTNGKLLASFAGFEGGVLNDDRLIVTKTRNEWDRLRDMRELDSDIGYYLWKRDGGANLLRLDGWTAAFAAVDQKLCVARLVTVRPSNPASGVSAIRRLEIGDGREFRSLGELELGQDARIDISADGNLISLETHYRYPFREDRGQLLVWDALGQLLVSLQLRAGEYADVTKDGKHIIRRFQDNTLEFLRIG